jgi:hypothetical protein
MFLLLFSLIQSQQSPRLSPFVIAVAVLAFIIGISLLVYFFRRIKTSEKEAEEDWSLSRRSLFVSPEPDEQTTEEVQRAERNQPEAINQAATRELTSIRTGEIHEIISGQRASEPQAGQEVESGNSPTLEIRSAEAPTVRDTPPPQRQSEPQPLREERSTEVLASLQPEYFDREAEAIDEAAPFDDEVWAGLEVNEQQSAPPGETERGTQLLGSNELWPGVQQPSTEQSSEQQAQPPIENAQPPYDARMDHRTTRAPFEPPRIERFSQREPFEPPIIEPLTPREQSTFIEKQKDSSPSQDLYASTARDKKDSTGDPIIYGANIERQPLQNERRAGEQLYGEQRRDAQALYEEDPRRVEPAAPPSLPPAPADRSVEPSVAARQVESARGSRTSRGAILGLPAEGSHGPLILGEPVRSKEERGIGALSNYGKPLEKDGGRGGTIALLAVILIIGGGLLAYFLSPSISSGINAWVKRLRGADVEEARRAAMTPKAVIYPRFNTEIDKTQVKIKGAVDNIWNEPLENLTVEVSLQRGGDAPPEVINVAVSPSPLSPNQRGTFDFQYEGKRDTGFTGYKITKLFTNGNEIKFTSPQKQ